MSDRHYFDLAFAATVLIVGAVLYVRIFRPACFRRDWRRLTSRPGVRLPSARDHSCAARFRRIMSRG